MPEYLSPGVYVEEVPSAVQAIAGVGTSTAGFIGVVPDSLSIPQVNVSNEAVGSGDGTKKAFPLKKYPVVTDSGTFAVRVKGVPDTTATLTNDDTAKVASVNFSTIPPTGADIAVDYATTSSFTPVAVGDVRLCTNFSEFKKFFGDFSLVVTHRNLAHAVYGFFNNGGTRCYVVRTKDEAGISGALEKLAAVDEIAIVAAPGVISATAQDSVVQHCAVATKDRVAILDSPEVVEKSGTFDPTLLTSSNTANVLPHNSDYAAFYFPWLQVFDPATEIANPSGTGLIYVPPSGHMAGIYARVDTDRGVHKAPANEVVFGAVGLKYAISKAAQDGLNPQGVNCIRALNGNIRVWGARTAGGSANGEWTYINVRRLFLYLRKSIDQGTQWAVFEPHDPALWAKIRRNVTAFLTNVWNAGALFGNTPQEAFFVKCDAETNPPEERDLGHLVTVIGVAVVKPAEFVIFRISQVSGPAGK